MDKSEISKYRRTLFNISEDLSKNDVRNLTYLCTDKTTVSQREGIKDALSLFEILEKNGTISEDDFTFLIKRMEDLKRNDLKRKFQAIMPGIGDCISPGPDHFTHASPQSGFKSGTGVFAGIPKPVRSLSEDSTSVDSTTVKAVYNIDGTPRNSSGDDQSVRNTKTFMHSYSLQNESPGPTHTIPSVCKSQGNDHSSGSTNRFSSGKLGASGSQVSGIGSDAGQASGGRGRNVEGMMSDLSLRDSTQSENLRSLPDDVETDSPSLVAEGYGLSSHLSQGRGAQAPIGINPVADSVKGHSCKMPTPRQDRVPISGPLLNLSSDSPEDTQHSPTPWTLLVDLSTDSPAGDHQLAELSGSLNERRELENRHKVKKMQEAKEELEAMTENDRLDNITGRQDEILEKIRRAEVEAEQQQAMYNLDKITIHCKECSALVCKASELRRKGDGGHVTCISPDFKKWVKEFKYRKPQRFRKTETIGLISCGAVDCGNQFGIIQKFLELHPPDGYVMKAESFKIHLERGGIKTPDQWKKAGFEIIKEENN